MGLGGTARQAHCQCPDGVVKYRQACRPERGNEQLHHVQSLCKAGYASL